MKIARWPVLFLALWLANSAAMDMAPNRESLIEAWETELRREGTLEKVEDSLYRYSNATFAYDGQVRLLAALVQETWSSHSAETPRYLGSVDFELSDLSEQLRETRSILGWMAERQSYVFDEAGGSWQTSMRYYANLYAGEGSGLTGSWWWRVLTGGWIWFFLLVFIAALLIGVSRQQGKARSIIDDSKEINRMARENLEQARQLQTENHAMLRESMELARQRNATLDAILQALKQDRPSP